MLQVRGKPGRLVHQQYDHTPHHAQRIQGSCLGQHDARAAAEHVRHEASPGHTPGQVACKNHRPSNDPEEEVEPPRVEAARVVG